MADEPCRILVCDDDHDTVESTAMLLRLAGHEVHTACDARDVLRLIDEFRPDIVLCDIGMPHIDGFDLVAQIRRHLAGRPLKIAAITGYADAGSRAKALSAGFDAFFAKPVDPAVIERYATAICEDADT